MLFLLRIMYIMLSESTGPGRIDLRLRQIDLSRMHALRNRKSVLPATCSLILVLLGSVASAAPLKEADLRKAADSDGVVRSLTFCARPSPDSGLSIPPYAAVGWGQRIASSKYLYQAIGAVPGIQPKALLGFSRAITPIPADLSQDEYAAIMDRCFTLIVSKADFQRALRLGNAALAQIAVTMSTQPVSAAYGLTPEQCVKLVVDIMKMFDARSVRPPPRGGSEPPLAYLRRTIEQNSNTVHTSQQ